MEKIPNFEVLNASNPLNHTFKSQISDSKPGWSKISNLEKFQDLVESNSCNPKNQEKGKN